MSSNNLTANPDVSVAAQLYPAERGVERSARTTLLTLGLCALILVPTLAYRMTVDQGIFAYMGSQVLEGRWPYLSTWESDYPGLMFLQAIEILLFGKSIVMFRLFDCLFQLGSAYFIYRITYRVGTRRAGAVLAAVLFCLIYQGYGPWNTAQREGFALFFVLAGFCLFFTAERRPAVITGLAIGLGLGMALLIKPTVLALSLFYLPLVFELRNRDAWKSLLSVFAGGIAPMAAVLTFYWIQGGLRELYEACVLFQYTYTTLLRNDASLPAYWLSKARRLGANAVWLPVVYAPFLVWGAERRHRVMLFLAYLGSLYAVFVQGTFAGYHYLPGLAIGAILIGNMCSQASDFLFKQRRLPVVGKAWMLRDVAVAALILLALVVYIKPTTIRNFVSLRFLERPLPNEYRNGNVFDVTEDYDVADYLKSRTEPSEPIQVWGYETLVYYLAERRAASRFQMTTPLVMRTAGQSLSPLQQKWRQEFMNDMIQKRPKYVAVVRNDNWWWAPDNKSSEELLNDFPEWKSFIDIHYRLEHTIGKFLLYQRL